MTTIRELNGNDFAGFSRLMTGFYQYSGETGSGPASIRKLFDKLTDPASNFICIAAFEGDGMVGMCSVTFGESSYKAAPFAWADDLFVEPEHRGRGAARLLLQRLKELASQRGCSNILLGVGNSEAHLHKFYRQNGFREMPCKLYTLPLGRD